MEDKFTADLLISNLKDLGLKVWSDYDLKSSEKWINFVDEKLHINDYFIALLSKSSLRSKHFKDDVLRPGFVRELADRSIPVVPVVIEDVDLPDSMRNLVFIDLKQNKDLALKQIRTMLSPDINIDFNIIGVAQFEILVSELFFSLGHTPIRCETSEQEYDFRISYSHLDPFGATAIEEWFVEVKHPQLNRLGADFIRQYALRARELKKVDTRIALVTSAQITSAAREIANSEQIRVVDGIELKQIVLTQPDIARRFFSDRR
jgi:hypothetical protein